LILAAAFVFFFLPLSRSGPTFSHFLHEQTSVFFFFFFLFSWGGGYSLPFALRSDQLNVFPFFFLFQIL